MTGEPQGTAPARTPRQIALLVLVFFVIERFFWLICSWLDWLPDQTRADPSPLRQVVEYLFFGEFGGQLNWIRPLLIVWLGLFITHRMMPLRAVKEVGLGRSPRQGLVLGLLVLLPTAAVLGLISIFVNPAEGVGSISEGIEPQTFWENAQGFLRWDVLEALASWILIYGFVFQQLRRRAHWSFRRSVLALWVITIAVDLVETLPRIFDWPWILFAYYLLSWIGIAVHAWIFEKWGYDLWVLYLVGLIYSVTRFVVPEQLWETESWVQLLLHVTRLGTMVAITLYLGVKGRIGPIPLALPRVSAADHNSA